MTEEQEPGEAVKEERGSPRKVRLEYFSMTAVPGRTFDVDEQSEWLTLTGGEWPYNDTRYFQVHEHHGGCVKITVKPDPARSEAARDKWQVLT